MPVIDLYQYSESNFQIYLTNMNYFNESEH